MNANMYQEELSLLAFLHENADGYGDSSPILFREVAAKLGVEEAALKKSASYLKEHGLVGARVMDGSSNDGLFFMFFSIWITGSGENFMRELEQKLADEENSPGPVKKITVKFVKEGWGVLRSVVVSVLTDWVKGHV